MLTNKQAREAKPRAAKYEVTCDALPGFVLRVLPTGKKVFFARYRDAAGRDHRQRLGLMEPGFGVDEARRMALVVLAQLVAGPSVPEALQPRPELGHRAQAGRAPRRAPARPPALGRPTSDAEGRCLPYGEGACQTRGSAAPRDERRRPIEQVLQAQGLSDSPCEPVPA